MPTDTERRAAGSGLTPEQLHAWRGFLEAHAAVLEVLERELREREDLPLTWYDVLVQLHEAEGGSLRMQELAEAVLLSKSGLTRLVDRMEARGLVERAACTEDRRGTYARITDAGVERLVATSPTHIEGVRTHFVQHLTDDEVAVLGAAFERIAGTDHRA